MWSRTVRGLAVLPETAGMAPCWGPGRAEGCLLGGCKRQWQSDTTPSGGGVRRKEVGGLGQMAARGWDPHRSCCIQEAVLQSCSTHWDRLSEELVTQVLTSDKVEGRLGTLTPEVLRRCSREHYVPRGETGGCPAKSQMCGGTWRDGARWVMEERTLLGPRTCCRGEAISSHSLSPEGWPIRAGGAAPRTSASSVRRRHVGPGAGARVPVQGTCSSIRFKCCW